ncbi:MAG: hypothetical protein JO345_38670 [Streptosporangiaceae bacterium]|nr:hypothetical protein [Streptosporangiaceae bacterium]
MQKLPGFRSGVWLNKSDSDHGLSLTIWDTREQAEGMVSMFGPDSGDQAGGTVSRCEINKVTASAFAFFSPGNLLI